MKDDYRDIYFVIIIGIVSFIIILATGFYIESLEPPIIKEPLPPRPPSSTSNL